MEYGLILSLSAGLAVILLVVSVTILVTLRGPVDTADEKRLIGEIAVRHASPGNVDNQLEVKVNTDSSGLIGQPTTPNKPKGQ